jgi:YHS domain-containing protein
MTWLFRFLLFLFVFFLLQKLVSYFFRSGSRSRPDPRSKNTSKGERAIEGQTVKDPQCGMYVASSLAIPLKMGGKTLYFCSEECKETHLREKQSELGVRT